MLYRLSTEKEISEFIADLQSKEYIINNQKTVASQTFFDLTDNDTIALPKQFKEYLPSISEYIQKYDPLIYGKEQTEKIVSIEANDDNMTLYIEDEPGVIRKVIRPLRRWILATRPPRSGKYIKLDGNLHYRYMQEYDNLKDYKDARNACYGRRIDHYTIPDGTESAMARYGYTLFKNTKVEDVSLVSFDIETSGLYSDADDAIVYMISNTYKCGDKLERKLFSLDDFISEKQMIETWVQYIQGLDPTILVAHNSSFDLLYLNARAKDLGLNGLQLGRDNSMMTINKPRTTRKGFDFTPCYIRGRHVIDTWLLVQKYDIGNKYVSLGLKPIIAHEYQAILDKVEEGKELNDWETRLKKHQEDRQFYDAGFIKDHWDDVEEREKIKKYCIQDSDDALFLYELMVDSFFYLAQYTPKPFQKIIESNSGSWINTFLIRSYLQDGHSIPKASERDPIGGGISHGVPGIYQNVLKFDAKSYYPSTIIKFGIYPERKDPRKNFLKMVTYFTERRFEQKDKYKETKDEYYNGLQASSKVFINSCYGALNTTGLNFNDFSQARLITKCCRKGLQKAIIWATGKDLIHWFPKYVDSKAHSEDFKSFEHIDNKAEINFDDMDINNWLLVNIDTDALSFTKADNSEFSIEEKKYCHSYLNKIMYCEWENDGEYENFLVLKAKNYLTFNGKKESITGSGFRDSKKEVKMKKMMLEIGDACLYNEPEKVTEIYDRYCKESQSIDNINDWSQKRTLSKKTYESERKQEVQLVESVEGTDYKVGDKVWVYKTDEDKLSLVENWTNNEDKTHLLKRCRSTLEIFKDVLDMKEYTKYTLEGKKKELDKLVGIE